MTTSQEIVAEAEDINQLDAERVGLEPPERGFWGKLFAVLIPILIVAGFVIATIAIVSLNEKPEEKRKPFTPLAVLATLAVQDDVQLVVKTQGEARPRTEIDLVPEVGGRIVSVSPKFIDGGIFNKGDILYQIDKSDYDVSVVRAEASVARAQQVLVRERAEAEIAKRDWADLGTGAPSDLTLRKPQLAEAQAGLQSAEADLQNAKIQLSRTSVRAPFNGRVRTKNSDIGQFVSPGSRLGRIFSTDIIEVRLPLTDDDLSKLDLPIAFVAKSKADAPDVTFSAVIAGKPQVWPGKIMRTDSSYDTQTRALFAIAEVFDPYGKGASDGGVPLAPGLFVDAEINGKKFENVTVLPRDGLRPENKVFVGKEDGSAETRVATVLDTNADYAYVTSGVTVGEIIVLSPVEESRLAGPLKIIDIDDTSKVLVDPPKPQWMIDKEKGASSDKKDRRKKGDKESKGEKEKPNENSNEANDVNAVSGQNE
jgi:RND family efflux transporter MFP subunit